MPSHGVCAYILHLRPEPFRMTHNDKFFRVDKTPATMF
jgi:hypothetical protein